LLEPEADVAPAPHRLRTSRGRTRRSPRPSPRRPKPRWTRRTRTRNWRPRTTRRARPWSRSRSRSRPAEPEPEPEAVPSLLEAASAIDMAASRAEAAASPLFEAQETAPAAETPGRGRGDRRSVDQRGGPGRAHARRGRPAPRPS
jgi:hypothetical protein